jgi:hypothetical protein
MKTRKVVRWSGLTMATAALVTAPALGQTVKTIQAGQTVRGTAARGVDFYRIGGPAGTDLTFDLTGPGTSGLIFYTPEGEEMLTATGTGKVRLTVVLPLDEVFVLGVIRNRKAYSLKVTGVEPDGHSSEFASNVGYRNTRSDGLEATQCWIDPGRRLKITRSNGEIVVATLGRGGKTYYEWTMGGRRREWEVVRTIEGDEVVSTTYQDGQSRTVRFPIEGTSTPNGGFVSYFCT